MTDEQLTAIKSKLAVLRDHTRSYAGLKLGEADALVAEVERLRAGKFTADEIHGICHNLHGTVDARGFADGCAAEQRKLYGCALDADAIDKIRDILRMDNCSPTGKLFAIAGILRGYGRRRAMKTVWKFAAPTTQDYLTHRMPEGAQILGVQLQHGEPKLWALVDPERTKVVRRFRWVGTGNLIEDPKMEFVGTVLIDNGELVFHLFEVTT